MSNPRTVIDLDWRSKVSEADLATKIREYFTFLDEQGFQLVEMSTSKSERVCTVVDDLTPTGASIRRTVRYVKPIRKTLAGNTPFWVLMFVVGHYLLRMVCSRTPMKIRAIEYNLRCHGELKKVSVSMKRVEAAVYHLCLSLKLHPYTLGIVTEEKGDVYIPEGTTMKVSCVSNISNWASGRHEARKFRLRGGQEHAIPSMAHTIISITPKPHAMLVTEHRSVVTCITAKNPDYLERVLLVMVSGREMVSVLSADTF